MNWALFLSGKPRPVGGELHNPDPDTYSILFYTSYKKRQGVCGVWTPHPPRRIQNFSASLPFFPRRDLFIPFDLPGLSSHRPFAARGCGHLKLE